VSDFSVRTVAPAAVALREVAGELTVRAASLDDWLVATQGLHPIARRPRLAQLTAEVRDVEAGAARVHQLSAEWRRSLDQASGVGAAPLPDLHQRLDAVEAALRELPTAAAAPIGPTSSVSTPVTVPRPPR
jgi:hypothetical protein